MKYVALLAIVIILLSPAYAFGVEKRNMELVGKMPGAIRAFYLSGDYAYLCAGTELLILDVKAPSNPVQVGSVDIHNLALEIYVSGNYAYVGTGNGDLLIINIFDPSNPHEVGKHHIQGPVNGIDAVGNYAYLAGDTGFYVIDISNLSNPQQVGFLDLLSPCSGVKVSGRYAYVVSGSRMYVIDILNPSNPDDVANYRSPIFQFSAIYLVGDYAYLAGENGGIAIVDISDPLNPQEMGNCVTAFEVNGLYVEGDYAYLADGFGLAIINVSNPFIPREVPRKRVYGRAYGVHAVGNLAYLALGKSLLVLNVSNLSNPPQEVGRFDAPGTVTGVDVAGNYAYLVAADLQVVDISNPANPQVVGIYDEISPDDVHVMGNYAYVVDGAFHVINITNPSNLQEVGSYETYGARAVYVSGRYAYVGGGGGFGHKNFQVVDIYDPSDPQMVGSCDTNTLNDIHVVGDYAYVTAGLDGFSVIDIHSPTNPQVVGNCPFQWYNTNAVRVSENYAYVADDVYGLVVVDISTPSNPQEVSSYLSDTKGVCISGNYAYLANDYRGLHMADISNPLNPREVGFYNTAGEAQGVQVVGDYMYVADGPAGFCILRYTGGEVTQVMITLKPGWSLMSFPVGKCFFQGDPPGNQPGCLEQVNVNSMSAWFSSAMTPEDAWEMVIGTEGAMNRSLPDIFNTLRCMSSISGYWVKIRDGIPSATLTLEGNYMDPDCPIPVIEGWNLVGCPLVKAYYDSETQPADTHVPEGTQWENVAQPVSARVFSSIAGKYDLIISETGAHDPALPPVFSSIHFAGAGYGFWIKMKQSGNLIYSQ